MLLGSRRGSFRGLGRSVRASVSLGDAGLSPPRPSFARKRVRSYARLSKKGRRNEKQTVLVFRIRSLGGRYSHHDSSRYWLGGQPGEVFVQLSGVATEALL